MRRIVCDTGPLLHFWEADLLEILEAAGQVHIPPIVEKELERLAVGWPLRDRSWIEVHPLQADFNSNALKWQQSGLLDPGEAQAIALAEQLKSDWLLTDDLAARLVAKGRGLEVHGSLGIVLWAAGTGYLDLVTAQAALERLVGSSLWISPRVLAEARSALLAMFPPAQPQ